MINIKVDTVREDMKCHNEMFGSGEQLLMEWAVARRAFVEELSRLAGVGMKELDMWLRAYEEKCPGKENGRSFGMVYKEKEPV